MTTEAYTYEPHNYNGKVGHLPYCLKCGLILMKNDFSRWADKVGCNNKDHPSYASKRGLTNPFK